MLPCLNYRYLTLPCLNYRYGRLDPILGDRHWNIDINVAMNDATSWNCQLFRSITSDSASFDPRLETSGCLNAKKGRSFESSICKVLSVVIEYVCTNICGCLKYYRMGLNSKDYSKKCNTNLMLFGFMSN